MSTYTPFEKEVLEKLQKITSDLSEVRSDVSGLKSDVSGLKSDLSEVRSDVSGLKSDLSEVRSDVSGLKSDLSEVRSDVSGLKSDMGEVKEKIDRIEMWNDKAFSAIEDLRTELKSDGAATRGMIYEAYEQISDMRDIIEKGTPTKPQTMNRYPRLPVTH